VPHKRASTVDKIVRNKSPAPYNEKEPSPNKNILQGINPQEQKKIQKQLQKFKMACTFEEK
jgi:hypothetical protein